MTDAQRRRLAAAWLGDLYRTVRDWNENFVGLLKTYPGFQRSLDPTAYRLFFERLLSYERQLHDQDEGVKAALCLPLLLLCERFHRDFRFLELRNAGEYETLYRDISAAYRNGEAVIDLTKGVARLVWSPDAPGTGLSPEERLASTAFLDWHVKSRRKVVGRILAYEDRSSATVREIHKVSNAGALPFIPAEEPALARSGFSARRPPRKRIRPSANASQTERIHLQQALAIGFGCLALGALVWMAFDGRAYSLFQLRLLAAGISIAAAGCLITTVGILSREPTLGMRLCSGVIGAALSFGLASFIQPVIL